MTKSKSARALTIGIALALALAAASAAQAKDKKLLSAAEITKMVSGNTFSGVFGEKKKRYAQRNHVNGLAVVHIEDSPVRLIPWFVKEPNSYCEDWDKDGVPCYQIELNTKTGERYFVYPDRSISDPIKVQEGFHPITFE